MTGSQDVARSGRPGRIGPVAAVVLLLAAAPAAAEEPLLSEQEFYAELPVVLTASRLAQPLDEAPAAVTVIDRQLIDASGARNLGELFRLVPGFVVGFESGHRHVVSNHGLADQYSRRLQVLIDGRSVYLPSFGGVSWSDLPLALDDIERIEVVRGPNAASYGANAFLGIISITTRHAASAPGGFVRATAGENDIRDGVLRAAGGDGGLHYRLTAGYQQDSGYGQRNDDRQVRMFNGRIDGRAGDTDDIEFQFGYNDGPRGRGYAGDPLNWPHDQEITSRFQQLRWRHRTDSGDELSVQLYYNHHESDEQFLSEPITLPPLTFEIPINLDVRSDRYDAELQHTIGFADVVRLVWGAGARLDRVEWPAFLGTPDPVDHRHYRLFGSLEWHATASLLFNLGAMVEHSDMTGTGISPRLAINYHLGPGHTVRAGVSSATRQPVLLEEQSDARFCVDPACTVFDQTFASSGNLDPEQIVETEIGYIGRLTPGLSLDLRVFHDQITRLIGMYTRPYPDIDSDTRDFRNSGEASLFGTDLNLDYRPSRTTRIALGYANVLIDSNDADRIEYSKSAPRNSLSVLGVREFGGVWQASAIFYYQDGMQYLDADPIGPMRRLDLRLARRFPLPGADAQAALVLQNVLGEQADYDAASMVTPGGYLTVSLQTH